MNTFNADNTPLNLAINEMFGLLQKHIGATCEPSDFTDLTAKIFQIMNSKELFTMQSLMVGLSNSIFSAIHSPTFNYADALAQINHDIKQVQYTQGKPRFTTEQENWICYQIGEWYLEWRNCIADYKTCTHRLGYAKEKLKQRLCTEDEENE